MNHLAAAACALAVAAAALVSAGGTAGAAPAGPGAAPAASGAAKNAGFGIQSATGGKPDARGYLTYSATPGARVDDQVAVVNIGNRPLTLDVYPTDATTGTDGSFALAAHSTKPAGLGSWLTLARSGSVRVPARTAAGPSYVIVPFTLAVPRNASPGDHAGAVVVSLTARAKNKQGVVVNLEQRVGLRVYVRVSGLIHPSLSIENLGFGYHRPALAGNPFGSGTATLHYTVYNTGNVVLGATQTADITSWLGGTTQVGGLPVIPPLLPGAKVDITRAVHGVFPGIRLTATVHLKPSAPTGAGDPALSPVSASASLWAYPWPLTLIVAVLLGGIGFWIWRRRRPKPQAGSADTMSRSLARSGAGK